MADMRVNKDPNTEPAALFQPDEADNAKSVQNDTTDAEGSLSGYSKAEEDIAGRICIPCAERIVGDILFSEKANVSLAVKERQRPGRARPIANEHKVDPSVTRQKRAHYTMDEFESKKLSVCKKRYNELAEQKRAVVKLFIKAKTEDEKRAASRLVMDVREGLYDLIKDMDRDAINLRPYTYSLTFNEMFSSARNDLSELRMISKTTTKGE